MPTTFSIASAASSIASIAVSLSSGGMAEHVVDRLRPVNGSDPDLHSGIVLGAKRRDKGAVAVVPARRSFRFDPDPPSTRSRSSATTRTRSGRRPCSRMNGADRLPTEVHERQRLDEDNGRVRHLSHAKLRLVLRSVQLNAMRLARSRHVEPDVVTGAAILGSRVSESHDRSKGASRQRRLRLNSCPDSRRRARRCPPSRDR